MTIGTFGLYGDAVGDGAETDRGAVVDCNENGIPDSRDLKRHLAFETTAGVPTGEGPVRLAAGDLNGDGLLDLMTTNSTSDDVAIVWNRGERTFEQGAGIPVGSAPVAIRAADVDLDGDLDILVSDLGAPALLLLANDGAGAFSTPVTLPGGEDAEAMEAADLDADGRPDIVVAREDPDAVVVLWGEGGGVFSEAETLFPARSPAGLGVADLDGDGDLDIVFKSGSEATDRLMVIRNLGSRRFEGNGTSARLSIASPQPADLDGDGHPDVVTAGGREVLLVFNDGNGGFRDEDTTRLAFPVDPRALAIADIDQDGDNDVVVGNNNGSASVSVLFNAGEGGFDRVVHHTAWGGFTIVTGDFDNDGRVDVATPRRHRNEVTVLWNAGEGRLEASSMHFTPSLSRPEAVAAGDLEGDGDLDLAMASSRGLEIFFNGGEGFEGAESRLEFEVNGGGDDVAVADLDDDGLLDVVLVSDEVGVSLFPGRGDGTFGERSDFLPDTDPRRVRIADVNSDGRPDLIVAEPAGARLMILANLGGGDFERLADLAAFGLSPAFAIGDLDGDGIADLVKVVEDGDASFSAGAGDGTFRSLRRLVLGSTIYELKLGDVDGDGDRDVVAAGSARVWVFANRGDAVFEAPRAIGTGDNIRFLDLADLDLDGDLDGVTANWGSDDVTVLVNQGDGTFETSSLDAGFGPVHVLAGDVDGDGLPEVVTSNYEASSISVAFNRAFRTSSDENANDVPDECEEMFHRGDANRDSWLDTSDSMFLFRFAFLGGETPGCLSASDANADGRVDIADGVYILSYLFRNGAPPPDPGPPSSPCGLEPAWDIGSPAVGCEEYGACRLEPAAN